MRKILENTSFIFGIAIIIGLIFPLFSPMTAGLIVPLLILVMTISLGHVKLSLKEMKRDMPLSIKAFLLNYGLLSGITILLSFMFIQNPDYLAGFVIMAAIPPAIAVVPFTYLLRGESRTSVGGAILCYVLALAVTPIITLTFVGFAVDVFEIMKILAVFILLPLLLSRYVQRLPGTVMNNRKIIVNVSYFIINYSIIGLNQSVIVSEVFSIIPLLIVNFLAVFVPGLIVYGISSRMHVKTERVISYTLFASLKNGGLAATIAILLLSPAASLPGAVHGAFTIAFFMLLGRLVRRR